LSVIPNIHNFKNLIRFRMAVRSKRSWYQDEFFSVHDVCILRTGLKMVH